MEFGRRSWYWPALLVLLAVGMVLRVGNWPHRYETRDVDEAGYLDSSLCLVEGVTPGYKAAPGGVQIWEGWMYGMAGVVKNIVRPHAEGVGTDMRLRPFVGMNQALFDNYRDLSGMHGFILGCNLLMSLGAVYAAYRYGAYRAGLGGGIVAGGLAAWLPLFVEYASMSRPYSQAWCLGIMALCAAGTAVRGRAGWTAVLLGLAIGTRVEMLALVPLVLWEFWERPEREAGWKVVGKLALWTAGMMVVTAPWLLTNLPGNLRAIATIQFSTPVGGATPWRTTVRDFAIGQGLALVAVAFLAGMLPMGNRMQTLRARVGLVIALGLIVTVVKSTGFGLHHKGYVMVALIPAGVLAMRALSERSKQVALAIAVVVVLCPLVQAEREISERRSRYDVGNAGLDWIVANVPAGTRLYVERALKNPLPTAESARVLWGEVTDDAAWRKKFESGLTRFGMDAADLPGAMSEENLVQERGNMRRWFICGTRASYPERRFDVRIVHGSPVFGVQDVVEAFAKEGGVVLWRAASNGKPPAGLGKAFKEWVNAEGIGDYVYVSPAVEQEMKKGL
ncbi:MAG TPA: hypothetical protein VFE58_00145 [Tepidisphaeraceae bacterium]|jgi:hypothetical protein|nr:hypothetical protein [Tepidisphaeraceae bacterium]